MLNYNCRFKQRNNKRRIEIEENKYYNKLNFFKHKKIKYGKEIVENEKLMITKNNALFIEAILKIDSRYKNASDLDNSPSIEYINYLNNENINEYNSKIHQYGSGSYWISKLVEIIKNGKDDEIEVKIASEKKDKDIKTNYKLDLKTVIRGVVCAIDRENSTHLVAHKSGKKVGRSNVSNKIFNLINKNLEEFKEKLLNENDFSLVELLTIPEEKNKENYHYSFATKFCKYLSLGFETDKYYIYDNVIINNIDYYIDKYNLNKSKYSINKLKFNKKLADKNIQGEIEKQYKDLWNCLEEIRKIANSNKNDKKNDKILRNELDHLIWYSNK